MRVDHFLRLVGISIASLVGGCAVMTVDVDVYKGPFINHEDVQREQVAALAMGAKPLLRELLVRMRDIQCYEIWKRKQPTYSSRQSLNDWHAQFDEHNEECPSLRALKQGSEPRSLEKLEGAPLRVSQLLSLYSDRASEIAPGIARLTQTLEAQRKRYQTAYEETKDGRSVCEAVNELDVDDSEVEQLRDQQRQEPRGKETKKVTRKNVSPKLWREVLSNKKDNNSEKCLKGSDELYTPIKAMLKSLLAFLAEQSNFEIVASNKPLHFALVDSLNTLLDMESSRIAWARYSNKSNLPILSSIARDSGIPEKKRLSPSEEIVVRQLLMNQLRKADGWRVAIELETLNSAGQPELAVYPTIGKQEQGVTPEELRTMLPNNEAALRASAPSDLEGGRDPKGLEKLVEEYITAYAKARTPTGNGKDFKENGTCPSDAECVKAAAKLQTSLVHFAQKLLTLSDFDILLRDGEQRDTKNYVQVLQAVGTAILSLSDDLERRRDYSTRIKDPKLGELQAEALNRANMASHHKLQSMKDEYSKLRESISALDPDAEVAPVGEALDRGMTGLSQARDSMGALVQHMESLLKTDLKSQKVVSAQAADVTAPPTLTQEEMTALGCTAQPACSRQDVRDRIAALNERIAKRTKATTELQRLQTGIASIQQREPLPVSGSDLSTLLPGGEGGPKRVMQVLLETLRFELAAEIRASGESTTTKRLRQTIAVVQQQAQRYSDLRPAVSYLRNSLPASVLQDDSSVMWKNLLQEHAQRGIPSSPNASERGQIQAAIDKQYWHSVNRIRVSSGGGNLNYVLARDDIGNWYVKSYSADASKTFRSALNLAMYAAAQKPGGVVDSSLLRSLNKQSKNDTKENKPTLPGDNTEGSPSTPEKPESSPAENAAAKLLRRYDTAYGKKALMLCKTIEATVNGLQSKSYAASRGAILDQKDVEEFKKAVGPSDNINPNYFPVSPSPIPQDKSCAGSKQTFSGDATTRRQAIAQVQDALGTYLGAILAYLSDVETQLKRLDGANWVAQATGGLSRYRSQTLLDAIGKLEALDSSRESDLRFTAGTAGLPENGRGTSD